ncbi:hypothetical protein QAD02_012985 [Eretmocerus hayati]|uniref:Uncharacterized protein n=1 Tax=Eretmocerus hayati TaxID=131215 RepID=A0ACC2P153_9HYME|nr:hypothetical protein QAD02_012985 [Eretmocerus hayati]
MHVYTSKYCITREHDVPDPLSPVVNSFTVLSRSLDHNRSGELSWTTGRVAAHARYRNNRDDLFVLVNATTNFSSVCARQDRTTRSGLYRQFALLLFDFVSRNIRYPGINPTYPGQADAGLDSGNHRYNSIQLSHATIPLWIPDDHGPYVLHFDNNLRHVTLSISYHARWPHPTQEIISDTPKGSMHIHFRDNSGYPIVLVGASTNSFTIRRESAALTVLDLERGFALSLFGHAPRDIRGSRNCLRIAVEAERS